ncbi:MAG: lipid-A-disaccharide synthase [Hellea sp.]|nr:lipid-A-disaccharide synthase [Hellea sp.]
MQSRSIFLVAAEPSGDQLGAALVKELRTQSPNLTIRGIGGDAMAAQNVGDDFDITPLAIVGFTEALKAYTVVRKKVRQAVQLIMGESPSAVVLIDSWGFMIRVAHALRKAGYKGQIIKYVAPQVWAMREGRAKVLANAVDHLLSIHSFDAPYFEKHGLPVTFVGNPMFDDKFDPDSKSDFRARNDCKTDRIMAVLFGSRPAEIEKLYDPFANTIAEIGRRYPGLKMYSPVPDSVAHLLREKLDNDTRCENLTILPEDHKYDLFGEADLALACSGTVSTQLAIMGVPAIICYKLSPVTALAAWLLFKPDYISLINISAERELMPEFVQHKCKSTNLIAALRTFIDNDVLREKTATDLMNQAAIMQGKGGPASNRAASAILQIIDDA